MDPHQYKPWHGRGLTLIPGPLVVALWLCAGVAPAAPSGMVEPAAASRLPGLSAMNLSAQQQQKLSDMESGSHEQTRQRIGQIHKLRDRLADLYKSYGFDVAEAQRLNQQLNRVQGQLLDLRLSEQQQLRVILTPEQFTQLQAALRKQDAWEEHSRDRRSHDRPQEHPGPDAPGHGSSR